MKKVIGLVLLGLVSSSFAVVGDIQQAVEQDSRVYCQSTGGTVIRMVAQFDTHSGFVNGVTKEFCKYKNHGNLAFVGLDTLSTAPTLAATYTMKLVIDKTKPLPVRPYANPAMNVCSDLHGTEVAFSVLDGGFADKTGQADICVFGDGSSISGWTMVYAADGSRQDIKQFIRSSALDIDIPNVQK